MISEKEELYELFVDYMQELWLFSDNNKEDCLRSWFEKIYKADDIEFYKIHLDENEDEVAGFLVVKILDMKHRQEMGADRYICEVYVKPKYRKRGLLSSCIRNRYIKSSTPVTMHILRQHEKAKIFWTNSFMKNFYTYENNEGEREKEGVIQFVKVS